MQTTEFNNAHVKGKNSVRDQNLIRFENTAYFDYEFSYSAKSLSWQDVMRHNAVCLSS